MLPDLLVDKSLGTIAVPQFLRSAWPTPVRTIDDVFGAAQVPDVQWMQLADERGWIAVCKDARIRTRPGERELMARGRLRVFCLANGNLTSRDQVARFRQHLPAMVDLAVQPGPWLVALYQNHVRRLSLHRGP